MTNIHVRQMLEQIERDYGDTITLRTMSATIGRQPAYLGRLFHQEVGSSLRDYLTRVRLEHAAELVRDGIKIEAVALSVGYRSKKNFYQRFKRHFGTTPLRYRAGLDRPSDPGPQTPLEVCGPPEHVETAADTPPPRVCHDQRPTATDVEPTSVRLATVIRASHRAWRLAVRAQEILLQHFSRLRVGILVTDKANRYIGANRAATTLMGYSTRELRDLSPGDLFVTAPRTDTRCVWQVVLRQPARGHQSPNAMVRTKVGESVNVYLVTLKNVLWGRREMSAMLAKLVLSDAA